MSECASNRATYDPDDVLNQLFKASKVLWRSSNGLKICGFAVGALALLFGLHWNGTPYVVAAIEATAELAAYRFEWFRGLAEELHRKVEFCNSLGWKLDNAEYSDLLAQLPASVAGRLTKVELRDDDNRYASQKPVGPSRAAENVMESAWWSKHEARFMTLFCIAVLAVGVLIGISALVVTIYNIDKRESAAAVSETVTSLLMLLISLGMIKLVLGYGGFAAKARACEDRASHLLEGPAVTEMAAVKLLTDYQLARAEAPMLPTWVWRMKRDRLNQLWTQFRASKSTPEGT